MRESTRQAEARSRLIDERMAQSSREVDEQIKATNKQVAGITDSLGFFVEHTVAPACKTLFHDWDIPVHQVSPRRKVSRNGEDMELDLTIINDNTLMVVEAKFTFRKNDLDDFIAKLPRVTRFFHEYRGMRVLGAVTGMVVHPDIARLAYKKGLFVLVPSFATVAIANSGRFKPKEWPQS
ncbi:MAG: hypothetical protein HQL60_08965 [Magnetococcales bacterium]|nr:hypothetical protein [Magnetococcales bacterium]